MKKKTLAFLFDAHNDSPTDRSLLAIAESMDKENYEVLIFLSHPKGAFARYVKKTRLPIYVLDVAGVAPQTGRFKGMFAAFGQSVKAQWYMSLYHVDKVISAQMPLLISFAVAARMGKRSMIWIQKDLWQKYPIATLWSGYVADFVAVNGKIKNSLPAVVQKKTRIIPLEELAKDLKNKVHLKKIAQMLFKDCNLK